MIDDKRMGEYCEFVKQYVPIEVKYLADGSASKSCENSACGNPNCSLSSNFEGDNKHGEDALGKTEHDIK